ncbi:hypothetical protein BH11ACT2_BH11ACT2_05050 [soil metagenome]
MGNDDGKGKLGHYRYDLIPANSRVTMTLANSGPYQDELAKFAASGEVQAFIAARSVEEERTDAPVAVRIFADSRMSGIVGFIPRGLEAAAFEALVRLEKVGKSRIPAQVERSRAGLRLVLLMGKTR